MEFTNLVTLLEHRAQITPDNTAFTYLEEAQGAVTTLSYKQLSFEAKALAATLLQRVNRGDRVLMLYPPGMGFIVGFFGCLYAGVVGVPAYPPRKNQNINRLQAIVDDADAKLVLATAKVEVWAKPQFEAHDDLKDISWLATDAIDSGIPLPEFDFSIIKADETAFFQYTSGSTGNPKGVMVTHKNIMDNERGMAEVFDQGPDAHMVSWLPHFHDLGLLMGILQPLYCGYPATLFSPSSFLQNPKRWLQVIHDNKATISAAPNFAFDLCVSSTSQKDLDELNLSSLELILNGAEPVRADTLKRFNEHFEQCGLKPSVFYPAYGMAEATLLISASKKGQMPMVLNTSKSAMQEGKVVLKADDETDDDSQLMVASGSAMPGQDVLVVNPDTLKICQDDEIGEVWSRGGSVAAGYWEKPELSEAAFQASPVDGKHQHYLRTGDLAFFHQKQLFITGRAKDLLIIRGQNHYPQDIEHTVASCHEALMPNNSAAFTIEWQGQEKLVVVQAVKRTYLRKFNELEVFAAIRSAVTQEHGLQVFDVLLLKPTLVLKTSSGKIQRRGNKQSYLDGSFDILAQMRTPEADVQQQLTTEDASVAGQYKVLESWITERLHQLTDTPLHLIEAKAPFVSLGLDSATALQFIHDLSEHLKRKLSPTLLFNYPNINQLVTNLLDIPENKVSQSKNWQKERNFAEPIAIIGMGCRYPGGAESPDQLWQMLLDGETGVKKVPLDRWDADAYYDPEPQTHGKTYARHGGFLDQVDQFDPLFFGLSPKEAQNMDPQQRLLLEVSWEALENANQPFDQLSGSNTGVFVGASFSDFGQVRRRGPQGKLDHYSITGTTLSAISGRVSYILNLRGPSMVIDTACSSSLVAVHQACQSLQTGDCDRALAGGVNVLLDVGLTTAASSGRMLSPEGLCKAFDARADGFVRGEGCGMVVMKRLSDAEAVGDKILAVIRASGLNHDGTSGGFTQPNGTAQAELIQTVLKRADVEPGLVDYVEAHGTGTELGDPIEWGAIASQFAPSRTADNPLVIGAIKTNIGHAESASGVAGLLKLVMSLHREQIPGNLNFETPNPHIDWDKYPVEIPVAVKDWPKGDKLRYGAVNSFGISGTNAHVLVSDYIAPVEEQTQTQEPQLSPRSNQLLLLSAKSKDALKDMAQHWQNHLIMNTGEIELSDFVLASQRRNHDCNYRTALIAKDMPDALKKLCMLSNGQNLPANDAVSSEMVPPGKRKVAFLFTGQGAQYRNMARMLYNSEPQFKQHVDYCEDVLSALLPVKLTDVLFSDKTQENGELDDTAYTQPALFVVEYALAKLWLSWGVVPSALVGHSIGEYAAACIAGVFSLEDALYLVAMRGRLMQQQPREGGMTAVMAGRESVLQAIELYSDKVTLAAHNGPQSCVISGHSDTIEVICGQFADAGIKTQPLSVSHAFHSPLMAPLLDDFAKCLAKVSFHPPAIGLISNVTGRAIGNEVATAKYWLDHIMAPVHFADGVAHLHEMTIDTFIEIGPKPVLVGMAQNCGNEHNKDKEILWLPSLQAKKDDWQILHKSLATLHCAGHPINWQGYNGNHQGHPAVIPTYPFQRNRCWFTDGPNPGLESQGSLDSDWINTVLASEQFSQDEKQLLQKVFDKLGGQSSAVQSDEAQDCYRLEWQLQAPASGQHAPQGSWVVLTENGGLGERFADALSAQGVNVYRVKPGDMVARLEQDNWWSVPVNSMSDFGQLLAAIDEESAAPVSQVVNFWQCDSGLDSDMTPPMENEAKTGAAAVLYLTQALVKRAAQVNLSGKLWLVSQNAQAVIDNDFNKPMHFPKSTLWGMGKTIAIEHPEIWGGLVDIDSQDLNATDSAKLIELMCNTEDDTLIALRDGQQYVQRLNQYQPVQNQSVEIDGNGAQLITGGLGGLGQAVAKYLMDQGAKRLVLTARRTGTDSALAAIESLQQYAQSKDQAIELKFISADVAKLDDMQNLMAEIASNDWPLKGIFHLAGLLDQVALMEMDWSQFEKVLAPKVTGTWILHNLTKDMDLDHFVCFSSTSAVWGSASQCHYGAANSFLDQFVQYRKSLGLPAKSMSWGPWSDVGMATDEGLHWLGKMGISAMTPKEAIGYFGDVLADDTLQATMVRADWAQFKQIYNAKRGYPLLENLCQVNNQPQSSDSGENQNDLVGQLQALSPALRHKRMVSQVRDVIREVIGIPAEQPLDNDQGLFDLGLDSFLSIELRQNLEAQLSLPMPQTLVFDHPTINRLSEFLLTQMPLEQASGETQLEEKPVATETKPLEASKVEAVSADNIKDMSDDDLAALIDGELSALTGEKGNQ